LWMVAKDCRCPRPSSRQTNHRKYCVAVLDVVVDAITKDNNNNVRVVVDVQERLTRHAYLL
jgi:hypothetical protein